MIRYFNKYNLRITGSRLIAAGGWMLFGAMSVFALPPEGYYNNLEGKSGSELMEAVRSLAAGHKIITYNTKTWGAFETTDVRLIDGRQAWWDMYSNNLVWLPEHASLNIEHSVANSWWGGKSGSNEAYSDLFHLNPSDQNANNKKGSYPPGSVVDARILDNGLLRIGTPAEGQGGGASSVFEPADEYKGDFARAYFYIFSTYKDLNWLEDYAYVFDTSGVLRPWAKDLLIEWHESDPVDSKEISRNEAIFELQKNRNPFIDHPELVSYIWGENNQTPYVNAEVAAPVDRLAAPSFGSVRMSNVNTYSATWWLPYGQAIEGEGNLYISLNSGEWQRFSGTEIHMPPPMGQGDQSQIRAYSYDEATGLRSSVTTLNLRASDPNEKDFSRSQWIPAANVTPVELQGNNFVLLSGTKIHVLSTQGGTTTRAFMESAGFPDINNEGTVTCLPENAAVVRFSPIDGTESYALGLYDFYGTMLGYWNTGEAKKMTLDPTTYTPCKPTTAADGTLTCDFGAAGTLQFNKSQPRFLNYTTSQAPVMLYKESATSPSGVEMSTEEKSDNLHLLIGIDGSTLIVPGGSEVYSAEGRKVAPENLASGVYIVRYGRETCKIRI